MKILEFEKFNTYPEKIKSVIADNITSLTSVYYDTLCSFEHKQDFDGYFDGKYGKKPIKDRIKIIQTVDEALQDYFIMGFHMSRLIDDDAILNNGLRTLNTHYYLNYMKYVFQSILNYNNEKTNLALRQLTEYLLQHKEESRQDTLSLFAPPSSYVINVRENCGFECLYGEYVGGEIAKLAFDEKIKEDLNRIGNPKVIQLLFPFSAIKTYGELPKDFAINQIIFFALQHILEGKLLDKAIFQTQITQFVPPENIIKIWSPKDIVNAYHGRYIKINGKFQKLQL